LSAGTNPLRTRKRKAQGVGTLAAAVGVTVASLGAGAALGQTPGGLEPPSPPMIRDVTCNVRCLDVRTVAETGRIEITGTDLASVETVRYPGGDGKLEEKPRSASDTSVIAAVPVGAASGKISVVDRFGNRAAAPVDIEVKPESAVQEAEGFQVTQAEAVPQKSFYNGKRQSQLDYLFEAEDEADVRIDVIEKKTGETVDTIVQEGQKPFATHSVAWDGLTGNRVARSGDYRFQISPLSGGAGAGAGFSYYDHIFPLRGNHQYGDGLGAGRGHQGQDVFAKCGTKIVAARGGTVQVNAYQSAAGNYIVIDGRKTGNDYVYMHMEGRGQPKEGARVKTGDVIGYESDTGRATGCHLHFELWSAPGWYEGGHVLNPTGPLKKWDKWS